MRGRAALLAAVAVSALLATASPSAAWDPEDALDPIPAQPPRGVTPAPPACREVVAQADTAVMSMYASLVKIALGDTRINERSVRFSYDAKQYANRSATCRAWALANGATRRGSTGPSLCFRALETFAAYAVTMEHEVGLLSAYGGRPTNRIDSAALRALGQNGTRELEDWLATSSGCLRAIGAVLPSSSAPLMYFSISAASGPLATGGTRQFVAAIFDARFAQVRIPVVWSVSPPLLGAIDNTGMLEAGNVDVCGAVIATAGDLSASMDVCVTGDAVAAGL
jgi:hypothetical protein